MVFTKLLLENALAIRPCNSEAVSEPLLPKIARCIPVLPSRYIGKCAARVLKRSALIQGLAYPTQNSPPRQTAFHENTEEHGAPRKVGLKKKTTIK